MDKREVLEAREMARDRGTRDKEEEGERGEAQKDRRADGGKGDEETERNSLNFFVAV